MEEESSVWEDLAVDYTFNNQEEAMRLVSILDSAKIDRFKAQFSFKEEYQLVEFVNEFKQQTEGTPESNQKKKGFNTFLKAPDGYPGLYTMELGKQELRGKIFMLMFKEEVSQIEVQNNYKIFSDRNRLRIYMKQGSQLNILCKNKLFSLKGQLSVLNCYDRGVIAKINNSQILKEQLEKEGIGAWFKMYRSRFVGFFFSKTLLIGEIQKKVHDIAMYSLSLFNFKQIGLHKKVNQVIFHLIKDSISAQLESLREEYEIEVEANENRHCLAVHKKHECFGKEVESELKKILNNLVIFSIQSEQNRTFCNSLRKELESMPFLKERMKQCRNQTFMAVNLEELAPMGLVDFKGLQNFLKFLRIVVDSTLTIRVFFHHLDEKVRRKQIERVIGIAEDNNLFLKSSVIQQKSDSYGIWTLKSYSEQIQAKRQRQFLQFIKSLLLRDQSNKEEIQSMIDSFFDDSALHSLSSAKPAEKTQKSKYQEIGKMEWYKEKLEPKQIDIEEPDKAFILSGRRRDLQKLFELNTRRQFKLWSLSIDSKINWPKEIEEVPVCIRKGFNGKQFNQKFEAVDPSTLKVNEKAVVAFMSSSLSLDFLPVMQIERVN